MKKTNFLLTLLMAVVMMAMSPTRVWADNVTISESTTISADVTYDDALNVTGGTVIINEGVTVTMSTSALYVADSGAKVINYGTISGNVIIQSGVFANHGTVTGTVTNDSGTFYNTGTYTIITGSATPTECTHTYENNVCTICGAKADPRLTQLTLSEGVTATFTDNDSYPWVKCENSSYSPGLWSSNKGVNSSTSTTTINLSASNEFKLSFKAFSDSEIRYDYCIISIDDVEVCSLKKDSNSPSEYEYNQWLTPGNHTVKLYYRKDSGGHTGEDRAYIYNFKTVTGCDSHTWGDWTETVAATCTEKGSHYRACSGCGKTETEDLPALGHDIQEVAAKAAGPCNDPGHAAHYHCTRCEKDFADQVGTMPTTVAKLVNSHVSLDENGICPVCFIGDLPSTISIADDGYYQLSTAADLAWFRDFVNVCVAEGENITYPYVASSARLMADIDMSSICSATTQSWKPIGESSAYLGTFDGNNHELKNIYINVSSGDYGFISRLGGVGESVPACVKNLTISGSIKELADNAGAIAAGAIAATAKNAVITNCHNKANVEADQCVSGIVGMHPAGSLSITQSSNSGNIKATNQQSGGIVGFSLGSQLTIEECNNSGSITANANGDAGGLAGNISGPATITKSYNTGSVTGRGNVGGLVGDAYYTSTGPSTVTKCYNTGTVESTVSDGRAYVGGIFGQVNHYIVNEVFSAAPIIRKSGLSAYGAFAGFYDNSTFNNCYYDNQKADCGFKDGGSSASTPSGNNGGKTSAEFASGKMAYLLNGNTSEGTLTWYQAIGGDETPTLEGDQYCIVKYDASDGYYNDKETLASLELVDGTAYSINRERTVTSLTYTRTFTGTNWTTWFVPFDLELTDAICAKYAFSRINNVHQYDKDEDGTADRTVIESFRQKSGVTLKANYPYLVKALTDADLEMELTFSNVNVARAEESTIDCQSVDYSYTFTGTYATLGNSGNTKYSLFDDTQGWMHFYSLKPQRHYMTITPRNGSTSTPAPERLVLEVIGDEDAMGIITINADREADLGREGKMLIDGRIVVVKNGKWYDAAGQQIR